MPGLRDPVRAGETSAGLGTQAPDTEALVNAPLADFDATLARYGLAPLRRTAVDTLQLNVGKRCNMACHHCHVDAGPKRTEVMGTQVAERVLALIDASPGVGVLDLTGGAPELNPSFRWLVGQARARGLRVIDRCNLSILLEPGQEDLADFLAAQQVEVVASMPCYLSENVDRQRGHGAFDRSILGLQALCARGYGDPDTGLVLDLVYNPGDPSLPPAQQALEAQYRDQLGTRFGIRFSHLLTITNMPIARFAESLARQDRAEAYMALLLEGFNPATVSGLMCRSLVSVGWDGRVYDCDFNQMLDLGGPRARTIWDLDSLSVLEGDRVATAAHCFGCTAGSGSSCGGALQVSRGR